ncbi:MAG: peptide deformylase [Magnetococcales bacterium]|nr:peptide deformylase [Magnetococcales bacterium]NGZ26302.1 peptide deformylase [Magnetococcales bacterium]
MTVLSIVLYPNEGLREICREVEDFTSPEFQSLVDDMLETMHHSPGCVGVAAPQVGHALQLLVMDCSLSRKPPEGHHGQLVVCNPTITQWTGMEVGREGCLSIPDYTGNVVRAVSVTVTFQDRHGVSTTLTLDNFEARLLQHEMDHLEGKLFIDRVVSRKADLFPRKNYQSGGQTKGRGSGAKENS